MLSMGQRLRAPKSSSCAVVAGGASCGAWPGRRAKSVVTAARSNKAGGPVRGKTRRSRDQQSTSPDGKAGEAAAEVTARVDPPVMSDSMGASTAGAPVVLDAAFMAAHAARRAEMKRQLLLTAQQIDEAFARSDKSYKEIMDSLLLERTMLQRLHRGQMDAWE